MVTSKVVLYTAIFDGYDEPKKLPRDLTCDAVLFTDDPTLVAPGWQVKRVVSSPGVPSTVFHKMIKVWPEQFVSEYDVALWIDGSVTVRYADYAERCLRALKDADVALTPHPDRKCIYDEAACITALRRGRPHSRFPDVAPQADYYHSLGHPRGWGLFASGASARKIHSRGSQELSSFWWSEIQRWTSRDQMSLPFVVRSLGDLLRWNADLPWAKWWSIAEHRRGD